VALVELPFGDRLERLTREILPAFARNMSNIVKADAAGQPAALPSNPLQLVRKSFSSRRELGTLLGKMRVEEGERCFFDGEPGQAQSRRHHKSDGFIFQPNMRYVSSRHYELLKWKWPELRSVDLQVHIGESSGAQDGKGTVNEFPIYLMCLGPDGTHINCTKRGDTNVGLGELYYVML
jgi:hypothetical protein